MDRPRRLTAQRVLEQLFNVSDTEGESGNEESDGEQYEETGGGDTDAFEIISTPVVENGDNEGDIEIVSENSSSSEESDDEVSHDRHETGIMEANGIQYQRTPFENRRRLRNIVLSASRNLSHPQEPQEAFHLFVTEEIICDIQRNTNRKVREIRSASTRPRGFMTIFSYEETRACIGLILKAGLDRDSMTDVGDLWSPIEGRPFYRAVLSQKRFCFFLRCLRLDNYRTRPERLTNDRLAAVSDIWNQFLLNLRRHYIPGDTLTVDEQLVAYRGRIPGRTYLPSKPGKYGLKIFWLAEAGSGFALNAKIYTGRNRNGPPERNLGEKVVMSLTEPYHNTGRDIVTDNFFTSHGLATSLLDKRLTLLGTIRAHRKEIPIDLRRKDRPVGSRTYAYDHENKIVILSFRRRIKMFCCSVPLTSKTKQLKISIRSQL